MAVEWEQLSPLWASCAEEIGYHCELAELTVRFLYWTVEDESRYLYRYLTLNYSSSLLWQIILTAVGH
jgi:hypothetical protein